MSYVLSAACGCDTGRRRRNNEDNFYFDGQYLPADNNGVDRILTCRREVTGQAVDFAVFDGMGGQADGQIASNLAASVFAGAPHESDVDHEQILCDTLVNASDTVWRQADAEYNDMGTTAAVMRFVGDTYYLSNVGDSRIFLFRGGDLQQISRDHTDEDFMRKMGIKDRKPRLTQYVGVSPEELAVQPYLDKGIIAEGDLYLLCSDGLTDMVSPDDIASVLSAQGDVAGKVSELIRQALNNGGRDNVTVIVVQVEKNAPHTESRALGHALNKAYDQPVQQPVQRSVRTGSSAPWALIALAAAVVIVIAGVLIFVLRQGEKTQEMIESSGTTSTAAEESEAGIRVEPSGIRQENDTSVEKDTSQGSTQKQDITEGAGGNGMESDSPKTDGSGSSSSRTDEPGANSSDRKK